MVFHLAGDLPLDFADRCLSLQCQNVHSSWGQRYSPSGCSGRSARNSPVRFRPRQRHASSFPTPARDLVFKPTPRRKSIRPRPTPTLLFTQNHRRRIPLPQFFIVPHDEQLRPRRNIFRCHFESDLVTRDSRIRQSRVTCRQNQPHEKKPTTGESHNPTHLRHFR